MNNYLPTNSYNLDPINTIHLACSKCNKKIVKLLIKYGANINDNYTNRSPIYYALWSKNLLFLKFLLKNGVKINENLSSHPYYTILLELFK